MLFNFLFEWLLNNWFMLIFLACAAGTGLYVVERRNRPVLRMEAVAEVQDEVEELQEELSVQELNHSLELESVKAKSGDAIEEANTKNNALRKELRALGSFRDANGDWPRAHFEDARRRAFAYYRDRLSKDDQPATQAAVASIAKLLDGAGKETKPAVSAPEAIAFTAGLATARRDLEAISEVDLWKILVGQLWSECESRIKSDLHPGWRWAMPRRGGGKSGRGGGPTPRRVKKPPAAPAPG